MVSSGKSKKIKLCLNCKQQMSDATTHCTLCHVPVSFRKPNSIQHALAYLLTALICLIPANTLPITVLSTRNSIAGETIVSGVVELYRSGSPVIAIVVFIASVIVPFVKIALLLLVILSLYVPLSLKAKQKYLCYWIVEFIGKWSMLDLIVLAILISVFHFNPLVQITAGLGASAFAGVVLFTLLAAHAFDTRLIWDKESD